VQAEEQDEVHHDRPKPAPPIEPVRPEHRDERHGGRHDGQPAHLLVEAFEIHDEGPDFDRTIESRP
jgi:hypothetical protein